MPLKQKKYQVSALTAIWTGGADRKSEKLKNTGLLGSIRWWFEVLARGLGGGACDPSNSKCKDKNHCVVCELFGCTGWARKFRFDVLDDEGKIKKEAITAGDTVFFRFTELRPNVLPEEWSLLDATLRLIAEYGAIGGKTVLKPSDEPCREGKAHHRDYGLFEIVLRSPNPIDVVYEDMEAHVRSGKWRRIDDGDFQWASIEHFWFVEGLYLTRSGPDNSSFNKVLGRSESKRCRNCDGLHNPSQKCKQTGRHPRRYSESFVRNDQVSSWLAGTMGKSKKVFSSKSPSRTFGFVQPGLIEFHDMKRRLTEACPDFRGNMFFEGLEIMHALLAKGDR